MTITIDSRIFQTTEYHLLTKKIQRIKVETNKVMSGQNDNFSFSINNKHWFNFPVMYSIRFQSSYS
jgi:hypothetical protein